MKLPIANDRALQEALLHSQKPVVVFWFAAGKDAGEAQAVAESAAVSDAAGDESRTITLALSIDENPAAWEMHRQAAAAHQHELRAQSVELFLRGRLLGTMTAGFDLEDLETFIEAHLEEHG